MSETGRRKPSGSRLAKRWDTVMDRHDLGTWIPAATAGDFLEVAAFSDQVKTLLEIARPDLLENNGSATAPPWHFYIHREAPDDEPTTFFHDLLVRLHLRVPVEDARRIVGYFGQLTGEPSRAGFLEYVLRPE